MRLSEIIEVLGLEPLTPAIEPRGEVTGGHASELLSDVLANAPRGGVLVTVQAHMNVVAVSVHADLGAVIFAAGRRPEAAVVRKAAAEGLPLYATGEPAFDVVGRLYELGLRGGRS